MLLFCIVWVSLGVLGGYISMRDFKILYGQVSLPLAVIITMSGGIGLLVALVMSSASGTIVNICNINGKRECFKTLWLTLKDAFNELENEFNKNIKGK